MHEKVENGKLKLLVTYDVIENIAKEEPIIPQEEPIIQKLGVVIFEYTRISFR